MKNKFQRRASVGSSERPKQERGHRGGARRKAGADASNELHARIERAYAEMPPSEKAIADLILDAPGLLAVHSATELATIARSSKAAVTRCVQRLGYRSFAQARSEAREARLWGSPLYLVGNGEPQAQSAPASGLVAHFAADIDILARTRDGLVEAAIEEAAAAIASARRVVVLGYRNSQVLAAYARSQLDLLRAGVELAPRAGETLAEALVELGTTDVLVAVGFRRRVPAFVHAMQVAHQSGARTLCVADPGGATAPGHATWTISCPCRGASPFDSYVGAMSVLNYLATRVAKNLGERARRRLAQSERLHRELGDLI